MLAKLSVHRTTSVFRGGVVISPNAPVYNILYNICCTGESSRVSKWVEFYVPLDTRWAIWFGRRVFPGNHLHWHWQQQEACSYHLQNRASASNISFYHSATLNDLAFLGLVMTWHYQHKYTPTDAHVSDATTQVLRATRVAPTVVRRVLSKKPPPISP